MLRTQALWTCTSVQSVIVLVPYCLCEAGQCSCEYSALPPRRAVYDGGPEIREIMDGLQKVVVGANYRGFIGILWHQVCLLRADCKTDFYGNSSLLHQITLLL